ncbi:uncharacterized protein LOC126800388 [Argentina anserina]|uniref:uncharacterized protein LOC126800388 n=1 Tax=Argentina anserina TaxID=57926 RepID=UPI0021768342|nr:uncharacterized protein LOC126800388 [Potentilla anserina]
MNKRVQIRELVFRSVTLRGSNWMRMDRKTYPFHFKLLGLEKESDLKLTHLNSAVTPSLHSCGGCNEFNYLRALHLREVGVTQEVLELFLSKCPVLERLSVESTKSLVGLRVAGPSIALKYLELSSCHALKSVHICDTNLVSVTINSRNSEIRLLLSYEPSLVEEYYPNLVFPDFANLKHLELNVEQDSERGLQNLISFLQASPHLEKLVLKLDRWLTREYYKIIGSVKEMEYCPHFHLKVVHIENYRGRSRVKHIRYLIKNAFALEKIVVKPIRHLILPTVNSERRETALRNHAMQCLKQKVPSSIEFVCM